MILNILLIGNDIPNIIFPLSSHVWYNDIKDFDTLFSFFFAAGSQILKMSLIEMGEKKSKYKIYPHTPCLPHYMLGNVCGSQSQCPENVLIDTVEKAVITRGQGDG